MQIQDKEGASKSVQILWLKFMQQTFILLSLLLVVPIGRSANEYNKREGL